MPSPRAPRHEHAPDPSPSPRPPEPWRPLSDESLPPVVIVGVASVIGLQTARLFHERGVRVIGVAGDPHHYAARTRACERVVEADVHGPGFLEVLAELGEELTEEISTVGGPGLPGPVLVPCTDRAVLVVAAHQEALRRWFQVPLAGEDVVRRLADKGLFDELVRDLALAVPATTTVETVADVERAAEDLAFPVVVKPSVKSHHWQAVTGAKVRRVETPDALRALCARVGRAGGALVVQELVEGGEDGLVTWNGYVDRRGRILAEVTTRKRRQWPPGLGIASYAEPADDPEVAELAARLFRDAGFHGLAYLEVKRPHGLGRPVLIEANVGRPTGRSAMAEARGVELLMTMYADAVGLALPPPERRRAQGDGPVWVNLRRDALAFWSSRRRGEITVGEWRRQLRGPVVHAVWSRQDPLPFIMEVCHSSRRAWKRVTAPSTRPAPPVAAPLPMAPGVQQTRRAAR